MQSATKENTFRYISSLSDRQCFGALSERCTHLRTVLIQRRSIEQNHFFHFISLEWLNTHTCMCQNVHLCKYPCKHSNLAALKLTAVCLSFMLFKQQKRESLSLLLLLLKTKYIFNLYREEYAVFLFIDYFIQFL